MKKKPTQKDVAKLAQVSQTTVSQVINKPDLDTIPEETKIRVFKAIVELGYVPNKTAISLRTRKKYCGLVNQIQERRKVI